jgi:hypothetical protein
MLLKLGEAIEHKLTSPYFLEVSVERTKMLGKDIVVPRYPRFFGPAIKPT